MFAGGPYINNEYAHIRHREMIRVAEKYRLLSQARKKQEDTCVQKYRFYQKAILKLSRQMIVWGTRLQDRYNQGNEAPELVAYTHRRVFGE